jgi:hypothetical protein
MATVRAAAFQPLAFPATAFQTALITPPPIEFGYAVISVLNQAGNPGWLPARTAFMAGTTCLVRISYFDSTDAPYVPVAVAWRLDDVVSGTNVVPWTAVAPDLTNQIRIDSPYNTMVSFSRRWETKQVSFAITDMGVAFQSGAFLDGAFQVQGATTDRAYVFTRYNISRDPPTMQ